MNEPVSRQKDLLKPVALVVAVLIAASALFAIGWPESVFHFFDRLDPQRNALFLCLLAFVVLILMWLASTFGRSMRTVGSLQVAGFLRGLVFYFFVFVIGYSVFLLLRVPVPKRSGAVWPFAFAAMIVYLHFRFTQWYVHRVSEDEASSSAETSTPPRD